MKNLFICILLGLSTWACNGSRSSIDTPESLDFEIVKAGEYSGMHEEQAVLIRNDEEWKQLWKTTHANLTEVPTGPALDFSNVTVVAVFMGDQASGGHKVVINQVLNSSESVLQVEADFVLPGKNCITTFAITSPYCIVKVAKNAAERISLKKKERSVDC